MYIIYIHIYTYIYTYIYIHMIYVYNIYTYIYIIYDIYIYNIKHLIKLDGYILQSYAKLASSSSAMAHPCMEISR